MTKAIFACAAGVGSLLIAVPAANAAPNADFNAYQDWTPNSASATDPGAYFDPYVSSKLLVISPYGTSHRIECRGDGHYAQAHDCRQVDDQGVQHNLNPVPVPGLQVVTYQ
ncbi:MAG: hypothetical protein J2P18_18090 [Nocardia sp.]|nr:hypothetical protein [Nocardia sp.]